MADPQQPLLVSTPADIAARRQLALAMMAKNINADPIRSPWQGVAKVLAATLGGYGAYKAGQEEKAGDARSSEFMAGVLGGGTPAAPAQVVPQIAPQTVPPQVAPMSAPIDNSLPRGIRNNNPLNIEAGSFTSGQPGFAGSDGRFAKFASLDQGVGAADKLLQSYANRGLNTVGGIVNRWAPPVENGPATNNYAMTVAKAMNTDPNSPIDMANPATRQALIQAMGQFENGRPIPTQQMAQAAPPASPPPVAAPPVNPLNAQIIQGLRSNDPYVGKAAQGLAGSILQKQLAGQQPTNDIKEYEMAKQQGFKGTLLDYQTKLKEAGKPVTTIDQRAPDSFERTYGEAQAKSATGVIDAGDKASAVYQRNQVLRALNAQIKTGKITPAQATIGAWAKSVGLDPAILGIDPSLPTNAETFNALSNESMMSKLGPGGFPSQNFSDTDRKFLEKTVTNLGDQPGANELKLAVSDRISQLQMEKADRWQEISTSVPRDKRAEAYDKFERDWRKEMKTRNVFGDIIATINAPPSASPGVAAPNGGIPPGWSVKVH